jgi:hypothetical protein
MLLLGVVGDAVAGHAAAGAAQIAWQAELDRVDEALSRNDVGRATLLWREAYAAALRSRHWEGLVAVGDAYRRLGDLGGFRAASRTKARQTYLAALFRARQEGSLTGALRVAEAFAELGDQEVIEQCIKVARALAAQTRDAGGDARVRAFAERWEARKLEVERLTPVSRGGTLR